MTQLISQFAQFFPEINSVFNIGLMILMRLVGLMRLAPVFSRTEIPRQVRISFAVIFTIIVIGLLKPQPIPSDCPLLFCMFINFCVGFMIGFVANTIFMAIFAAGDIINTQMGLQSATQMDPSQHTQTTIMSRYFTFLGVLIFIYSGGIYWLLNSFIKSFEYFPMYSTNFHFEKVFNIQLLVDITSNIMFVGMQIAAPIVLATLGQDLILGIISKTSNQQINVFQLSFLFKPILGAFILIVILPMLINVITNYLVSYAGIFQF